MIAVIGFIWYFELLEKPYPIIRSNMDRLVLALLIWVIFSIFFGLIKDHSFRFLLRETIFLFLYIVYFIFRDVFRDVKYLRYILIFFLFITTITSIQYILLFFSEADIISIIFKRVVTQQTHIIIIGYLILLNLAFFNTRRKYRIVSLMAILPHILAMFFSQQRALWGAAVIGTVALIFLNGKRSFSKKTWLFVWLGFGAIVMGLILLLTYIENIVGGSLASTAFSRIEFIFNLTSDLSLNARIAEILVALKQWEDNPLLGTGLGSSINRFAAKGNSVIVDNSYVNYLWKMGIIGLAIYLGILLSFFSMGIKAVKSTKLVNEKNLITAVLIAFGSLLIVALTNSCLYIYHLNIIWAMMFAVVHRYYDKNVGSANEHLYGG
jgi:O-antigen ligase